MTDRPKITNFDALAILLAGALARFGAPFGALALQLAGMAAGVFGALALIWNRPIAAIALFPVAWALWWFGDRAYAIIRERPLNQMLDESPVERDKPS